MLIRTKHAVYPTDPWLYFTRKFGLFSEAGGEGAQEGGEGDPPAGGGTPPAGGANGADGTPPAAGGDGTGDPAAPPAGDPPALGAKPPAAPDMTGWHSTITDPDIRKTAERYATPAELAKGAHEARQSLSKSIVVPGENATDEDRANFNKALGVPEEAKGYELKLPDEMAKRVEDATTPEAASVAYWQGVFHDASLTPVQAQKLADAQVIVNEQTEKTIAAAHKTFADQTEEKLRVDWAGDFDRNKELANRFVVAAQEQNILTPAEVDAVRAMEDKGGTFILDHPAFLKLFSWSQRISRTEDAGGAQYLGAEALKEKETRLEALRGETRKLSESGDWRGAQEKQKEVDALDKELYPQGPIVGVEGRSV